MQGSDSFNLHFPWLQQPLLTLTTLYEKQQLAHALLLTGANGVGKWPLARRLARALLCKQLVAQQPCEHCKSCLLDQAGNHADLLLLQPEGQSLGVDEIRRISDFTHGRAQQQGNKVIVIQHAERMTEAAANALLKTLEEPPQNCYLLLCCQQPQRLKPTILSRCQRWPLSVMSPVQLQQFLTERGDQQLPDFIWSLSAGAPLQAEALLQNEQLTDISNLLAQLQAVFQGEIVSPALVKQLEGRSDTKLLLSYSLQQYLQQALNLDPQRLVRMQSLLFAYCRDEQQILGQNKTLSLSALLSEWQRLSAAVGRRH